MECKDILNLIAIVVIPLVAVLIGQYLQNRAEIRKDKMHIFKVLMTSRIYGWTQESVHCLNIIDIVFADDKKVRDAWKDLYDKYCVENPDETQIKKIQNAQYKLLETMANIYLVGLIAISLMQNLLPIVSLKFITAICIFIILHILFVLLESVAQMYLTFWANKK